MQIGFGTNLALIWLVAVIAQGCAAASPITHADDCFMVKWRGEQEGFAIDQRFVRDVAVLREWWSTHYYGINLDLSPLDSALGSSIANPTLSRERSDSGKNRCFLAEHLNEPRCTVQSASLSETGTRLVYAFKGSLEEATQSTPLFERLLEGEILGCS